MIRDGLQYIASLHFLAVRSLTVRVQDALQRPSVLLAHPVRSNQHFVGVFSTLLDSFLVGDALKSGSFQSLLLADLFPTDTIQLGKSDTVLV
jgi:hypothetical protein